MMPRAIRSSGLRAVTTWPTPRLERLLLEAILRRISSGGVTVTFWDGSTVTYGPGSPSVHITVKTAAAARRVLRNMSLGFGEGYMDGDIEVAGPLDRVGQLVSENGRAFGRLVPPRRPGGGTANLRGRQKAQIQHHYDLGNDFFELWLDRSMTYSCAYFQDPADTLEAAQDQKRQHLLRKLQLSPGMRMLDIGSGWGQLLFTAAEEYGVTGVGVTLSAEQYAHCVERAASLGLADSISFELVNYQDLAERGGAQFDRVSSVGMFEHVGKNNQRDYFRAIDRLLKPQGVSVLQTIYVGRSRGTDPWIDKYIFPGGHLPELADLTRAMGEHDQHLLDVESLGLHYAMTLDEWWRRYEEHKAEVIARYGERFYRMWRFWLAMSSAGFRYGGLDLAQIVFTKGISHTRPLTRAHQYHHPSHANGRPHSSAQRRGAESPRERRPIVRTGR